MYSCRFVQISHSFTKIWHNVHFSMLNMPKKANIAQTCMHAAWNVAGDILDHMQFQNICTDPIDIPEIDIRGLYFPVD